MQRRDRRAVIPFRIAASAKLLQCSVEVVLREVLVFLRSSSAKRSEGLALGAGAFVCAGNEQAIPRKTAIENFICLDLHLMTARRR